MDEEQPKGFKVTDRRIFADQKASEPEAEPESSPSEPVRSAAPGATARASRSLPPMDFHTFVISIGSTALLSLGVLEDPQTGERGVDLILAKHNIDLLALLEDKTRGNLTTDESSLLSSLLYDLRLKYVEVARGGSAPSPAPAP